jgi:Na+/H+ antiporter NhaD/arsenite permease-like protein
VAEAVEGQPVAEALVRKNLTAVVNNIPVVVTDVPSIESPSNFQDLLQVTLL